MLVSFAETPLIACRTGTLPNCKQIDVARFRMHVDISDTCITRLQLACCQSSVKLVLHEAHELEVQLCRHAVMQYQVRRAGLRCPALEVTWQLDMLPADRVHSYMQPRMGPWLSMM